MAGKAHGDGERTIGRRKEGRWYARYHALTSEGKKRKAVYDKTRVGASEKLNKALGERDGRFPVSFDTDRLTVGEYLTTCWRQGTRACANDVP